MLCSAKIRGIMVEYLPSLGIYVQSRAVPALHRHIFGSPCGGLDNCGIERVVCKIGRSDLYTPIALIQMRVPT